MVVLMINLVMESVIYVGRDGVELIKFECIMMGGGM